MTETNKETNKINVHVSRDPMVDPAVYDALGKIQSNFDELLKMPIENFVDYLINKIGTFKSERDLRLFLIESLGKELTSGEIDFPVTYYKKEEDIPEKDKIVEVGDASVDTKYNDYVNKMENKNKENSK